jgi:8-oxo-dGTP pyrophosphatase MutT (NUDIX family)
MNTLILANKELLLETVIDKLGNAQLNFAEKQNLIRESALSPAPLQAAGVILPIFSGSGGFFFRLCKRSHRIPQAGDLSCPGGMLQERWDKIIMRLVTSGVLPLLRNKAGRLSRQRDAETFQTLSLFLANALREAWEEVRLNPFSFYFLGPLPAYSLQLFQRIIFPLVGLVPKVTRFRPNYEVESLVDIPVAAFFHQDNYATLIREVDGELGREETEPQFLPCLIYNDLTGAEHVLWGATFFVIISFLEIIFNFELPEWRNKRLFRKTIDLHYLSGEGKRR